MKCTTGRGRPEEKYLRELETQKPGFKKQSDEAIAKASVQFASGRAAYQRKIQELARQMDSVSARRVKPSTSYDTSMPRSVRIMISRGSSGSGFIPASKHQRTTSTRR